MVQKQKGRQIEIKLRMIFQKS